MKNEINLHMVWSPLWSPSTGLWGYCSRSVLLLSLASMYIYMPSTVSFLFLVLPLCSGSFQRRSSLLHLSPRYVHHFVCNGWLRSESGSVYDNQCISLYQYISISTYQCINISVYQCFKKSNMPIYRCINTPIYQYINTSIHQCVDTSMHRCMNMPITWHTTDTRQNTVQISWSTPSDAFQRRPVLSVALCMFALPVRQGTQPIHRPAVVRDHIVSTQQ